MESTISNGVELPKLVQTDQALVKLVRELGTQPRIAVDTESNSLHAYRERVCLIQFSAADRDYVLDPLALDNPGPLAALFSDSRIEKIFHAAEYDVACLRRDFGFSFNTIFDTMQAARILGHRQVGLDHLLQEKFAVKVNKRFQKADWGVRPLSRDLLLYAAQDTRYLIALRDLLQAELQEKQLWQLAQEDFRMICNGSPHRQRLQSAAWTRYSIRRDLDARDLTVLKELLDCREQIAERLDRPPFKVLDDERLAEIAKARPATFDELGTLGLGTQQQEHWGRDLLEAVARGLTGPLVHKVPTRAASGAHLKRLEKLKQWRKQAAAKMQVESDVVLPRSLLLALAEDGLPQMASIMKFSPWRLDHFGPQIADVLQAVAIGGSEEPQPT